jgi:hypothetical protein
VQFGAWNAREDFTPVLLQRILSIPISLYNQGWNYNVFHLR